MSISSNLANITNAIAAISVSGVTIKDKDEIASSFVGQANTLIPNPFNFLTNLRLNYQSFTRGASSQVDLSYTLNYRFLATAIGSAGNVTKAYSDMVDKVILIINAMITTETESCFQSQGHRTRCRRSLLTRMPPMWVQRFRRRPRQGFQEAGRTRWDRRKGIEGGIAASKNRDERRHSRTSGIHALVKWRVHFGGSA